MTDRDIRALHYAKGALDALVPKEVEVPTGLQRLGGYELTLTFPPSAAVDRGVGTKGNGWNSKPAPPIEFNPMAALLFLERLDPVLHDTAEKKTALWSECILDAEKGIETMPPALALEGLEAARKASPKMNVESKTPAGRTDAKLVTYKIRRLKPARPKVKKTPKEAAA